MDKLESWTANADVGVKFFSGTATYAKALSVQAEWLRAGAKISLDLGRVADIAEVSVNGRTLGTLWKAPWRIDVSGALQSGNNLIEIKITNEWTNRLAGDRDLPAGKKVLADPGITPGRNVPVTPLVESGLLGPVALLSRP